MKKAVIAILIIFSFASCRAKYEALMLKYNKTQERISKTTKERKKLQSQFSSLSDSINNLLIYNRVWKRYYEQTEEIKNLKLDFYEDVTNNNQSAINK